MKFVARTRPKLFVDEVNNIKKTVQLFLLNFVHLSSILLTTVVSEMIFQKETPFVNFIAQARTFYQQPHLI